MLDDIVLNDCEGNYKELQENTILEPTFIESDNLTLKKNIKNKKSSNIEELMEINNSHLAVSIS